MATFVTHVGDQDSKNITGKLVICSPKEASGHISNTTLEFYGLNVTTAISILAEMERNSIEEWWNEKEKLSSMRSLRIKIK